MSTLIPDDDSSSQNRSMSSDFEIEEIRSDPESIAYGLFSNLVAYEDHYNNIQKKYKALAITWTISTFIAIGYVISGYEKNLYLNPLLIILFLSVIAAQGISLLWFLDAGVYEALIFSIWKEIYSLEDKFPAVGKSIHNMHDIFKGEEVFLRMFHGVFYAYFVFSFSFIGLISLSLYLFYINKWLIAISVILLVLIIFIINRLTRKPLCFDE